MLPIAETLLTSHYAKNVASFILALETVCNEKGIRWPISKRICTDWSTVLINAVLLGVNKCSLEAYLKLCHNCCTSNENPKFVILQLCCAHFIRMCDKDIKSFFKDPKGCSFLKIQLWKCLNISVYGYFLLSMKHFLIILINPQKTAQVEESLKFLENFQSNDILSENKENQLLEGLKIESKENLISDDNVIFKNSPFYKDAMKIFDEVHVDFNTNGVKNEFYCEPFAGLTIRKYFPYVPLWTNVMGDFIDHEQT